MKLSGFFLLALVVGACVQKTRTVTVVYNLNVYGVNEIESVGVRGGDKPLNWSSDFNMEPIVKDSLYRAYVTYTTGYLFTEIKFVVNDTFELAEQANRRVVFAKGDTTVYEASYNVAGK